MRRLILLALLFAASLPAAKSLEIYFIDAEGGQATLFVAPSGESMLVDAGWGGFDGRDAVRIAAAAKAAGVKRIDYLVITHYHQDHVGGVRQLAAELPIRNFVDHGETVETGRDERALFLAYQEFSAKGRRIEVKPGDTIPVADLRVDVVASAGNVLAAPLAGAPGTGEPNAACTAFQPQDEDKTENAQSIGLVVTYGEFRIADLGDLTWNKERGLVCPENKLGRVDLFLVSHHGAKTSNSPQLLNALRPRAAIVNNAARKGGSAEAWQTVHDTPGLQDIWQLHYSVTAPEDHNSADPFIANLLEACQGRWLRVTAERDGAFTVFNGRNKFEKRYGR